MNWIIKCKINFKNIFTLHIAAILDETTGATTCTFASKFSTGPNTKSFILGEQFKHLRPIFSRI